MAVGVVPCSSEIGMGLLGSIEGEDRARGGVHKAVAVWLVGIGRIVWVVGKVQVRQWSGVIEEGIGSVKGFAFLVNAIVEGGCLLCALIVVSYWIDRGPLQEQFFVRRKRRELFSLLEK